MVDLVGIGMTSARRQMVTLSYGTIEGPKLEHSYLKQKTSAQVLQQFDSILFNHFKSLPSHIKHILQI